VNPRVLVIRADAGVAMGTGHVMRCLALAQAWRDGGGDVAFAMGESTPAISRRVRGEGFEIALLDCNAGSIDDTNELAAIADEHSATWIVVDGYQFDSAYQSRIKASGYNLVWVDDMGACAPYTADIVLNQNAYAGPELYRDREPGTVLLLGSRYALLRKEFLRCRSWQRDFAPRAKHVLITMGGSDPDNASARIVEALCESGLNIKATLVIGGANPQAQILRKLASQSNPEIRVQTDVRSMAELMAGADLAISAAGGTCYELALLRVPMLLVALAENQIPTARSLAARGAAIDGGEFQAFDPHSFIQTLRTLVADYDLRCSLARNARELVDGNGARRVSDLLLRGHETESRSFDNLPAAVS
jgi:UDP-2,4-diacetamido-2,4,6-trideoxy-beta-L-altropyranose hydrolase